MPNIGSVNDGILHAVGWFAAVAALFLFAELRRRRVFSPLYWWAGLLVGAGGFQRYDGTMQHKLIRLHQIRYHVNPVSYDCN